MIENSSIDIRQPLLQQHNVSRSTFYQGDCLKVMSIIPDGSIDMVFCDLPYKATQNKWDILIEPEKLWEQYERLTKENAAIVLTGKQPFTAMMIMSNLKMFKYNMIWRKNLKTGNLNARKMPMGAYEDIMVFYKKPPTYNPQQIPRTFQVPSGNKFNSKTTNYGKQREEYLDRQSDWLMPDDVIDYEDGYSLDALELENEMLYVKCVHNSSGKIHPTQKPVELMELLIKMYTNEGETVLDNCFGSASTAIACENLKRNFVGIEQDLKYYTDGVSRVSAYCGCGIGPEGAKRLRTAKAFSL